MICFLIVWHLLPTYNLIPNSILPSPINVITSIHDMYLNDDLFNHIKFSLTLNFLGYIEAITISLIFGFIVGLFPLFRGLFEKPIATFRFLPLSAMTGIFIAWFGIDTPMKIQFLAFGIFVYMIPVVIQRIDEVQQVYIDTVNTLGAGKWQTIKTVFIPDVLSRFFDDIRVLTAISWTYIIIAEMINKTSGLGALTFIAQRQSRTDKLYAVLFIIMMIGFFQDQIFKLIDRFLFRFKYKAE